MASYSHNEKSKLPPKIKPLDVSVINKIAAGEIIVAPANALKELLENSIDAGSTSIDIVVKDGGLKLLQITDNGHGINREDLGILCERFTTSKISSFEDLTKIATYGFRGEALASISHIAHLTVTTRSKESDCAWRATYLDGKLAPVKGGATADPRPVAGRIGTQILVEDLFFNVPSRLRAFRSAGDEYNRIADVVGRYAIHSEGIAFTCKKQGEAHHSLITTAQASTVDRIRTVYGAAIANELVKINVAGDKRLGLVGASGYATNANFNAKKSYQPVLFINHRAVTCDPLKRALSQLYSAFLPKGGHSFTYLSLLIAPDKLDVNVHPTKREVRFLNEDDIIQRVCESVQHALGEVDTSRVFKTQSVLMAKPVDSPSPLTSAQKRTYEYNMVRTDAKERKITTMFRNPPTKSTSGVSTMSSVPQSPSDSPVPDDDDLRINADTETAVDDHYEIVERERVNIRLHSVKQLREEVRQDLHKGLTDIFANHIFVGIVDENKRLAAIQCDVKLYLVDYAAVSYELFYQIGLSDFGNFGVIQLSPPLSIRSLLKLAVADGDQMNNDQETEICRIADQMISMRAMLLEYFSLDITAEGDIRSIPLLLKGYTPSVAKLPTLLYRLGHNVNWTNEKECFSTLLREIAIFYVPESLPIPAPVSLDIQVSSQRAPSEDTDTIQPLDKRRSELKDKIEKCIFPTIRRRLLATKKLLGNVIEVAALPGLYKIFERC
ncbi:histidine kinase-like ATPase [Lipomyces orientalis]|uniref:Histidine kinase-like ATPase n=1 Tax=Lipomyces orientalis TaxID=1233043 RepID=A0ACC3TUH0_9ASCO